MAGSLGDGSDLTSDLLFVRKGRGFVPDRVKNTGALRHVLGGRDESYENLRSRLISAIRSLRDPDTELLLAAFGLTDLSAELPTLKQRRQQVGRTLERGIDTVTDRENAALARLRAQLLTGWYPQSPLGVRVPEMHNGIIQESVHVSTVVEDRKWKQTREHYRFLALFEEAEFIAISSSYPGRPIPEGDFTVKTVRIGQSFSHQFWHKTPMRRGQIYDLQFTLVADEGHGTAGAVVEESRAFHERTLTATIEVQFVAAFPNAIWQFDGLTFFERPDQPSSSRILRPDNNGAVRTAVSDQYAGLFCGVAWRW